MKLAYWMYSGPAHIGTLRIASSFQNVHAIMHAPLGDDYFNVLRSMLERERDFTPVTASIVDRHVLAEGSKSKVVEGITRKAAEDLPDLILLTPTCTSSILQEDLESFVENASRNSGMSDVILADVNHYRVNEMQAADRTLEQIVRFYVDKATKEEGYKPKKTKRPSANIIGPTTLGFHHHHDARELKRMLGEMGIDVNMVTPEGGRVTELKHLTDAWFNIVPYRETGLMAAKYLERQFDMPFTDTVPMGILGTNDWITSIQAIVNEQAKALAPEGEEVLIVDFDDYSKRQTLHVSQAAWFSRSVDCQNLTGKRAVVFGDATHAAMMTRILSREMCIRVVCAGTYARHESDWFREQVQNHCDEILITDDNTQVADMIARLEPAAIFGTQMERHVGKRLDTPCGVISSPVHIQNFPLGFRPFFGYEGANQISDLVYNSFALGMEDHLLEIFGGHDTKEVITKELSSADDLIWLDSGIEELGNIPGFVRGKVKRNVEKFARHFNIHEISAEVMWKAKEKAGKF